MSAFSFRSKSAVQPCFWFHSFGSREAIFKHTLKVTCEGENVGLVPYFCSFMIDGDDRDDRVFLCQSCFYLSASVVGNPGLI